MSGAVITDQCGFDFTDGGFAAVMSDMACCSCRSFTMNAFACVRYTRRRIPSGTSLDAQHSTGCCDGAYHFPPPKPERKQAAPNSDGGENIGVRRAV